MAHPHADLIRQLGGAPELARRLGNVPPNMVGNWLKRGIPWGWRNDVSHIALAQGIDVPAGFLSRRQRVAA